VRIFSMAPRPGGDPHGTHKREPRWDNGLATPEGVPWPTTTNTHDTPFRQPLSHRILQRTDLGLSKESNEKWTKVPASPPSSRPLNVSSVSVPHQVFQAECRVAVVVGESAAGVGLSRTGPRSIGFRTSMHTRRKEGLSGRK